MKTCGPHGYNPPSACPNCRITKRRANKQKAVKGWETRRKNHKKKKEDQNEQFAKHGWTS